MVGLAFIDCPEFWEFFFSDLVKGPGAFEFGILDFRYDENHFSGVASLRPPFGVSDLYIVQFMVNCLVLTTNWQGGPTHCQFNEFQTSPNHDPISVND